MSEPTSYDISAKKLFEDSIGLDKGISTNAETLKLFEKLFNSVPAPMAVNSYPDRIFIQVNKALLTKLGYTRTDIVGKSIADLGLFVHSEQQEEMLKQLDGTGHITEFEIKIRRKDKTSFEGLISGDIIENQGRKFVLTVMTDMTKLKHTEALLQQQKHDLNERVKELNCLFEINKLVAQKDCSLDEMFQEIVYLIPPSWRYPEITCARIFINDMEFKTKNFQTSIWKQSSAIKVYGKRAGVLEVYYLEEKAPADEGPFSKEERKLINAIADQLGIITERKLAQDQIRHLADHDALTDLPIMRLAKDRIQMALEIADRDNRLAAVLYIDLDGFKSINDAHGHAVGDLVLKEIAKRLLTCIRKVDTVARIAGDEFLVVLTELHSREDAALIAKKIKQVVSQPIVFDGQQTKVGTSIGIAIYPGIGKDADSMLSQADKAMYSVKYSGKNGYSFAE
jgi:diguanylate cyclase (GGDEF)-like protein/PAS domain S-box-containing protein